MSGRRLRLLGGAVGSAFVLALVGAPGALAHPLGNFTINHLDQVRISSDKVQVHYVLDQAEIPTFQDVQRFDKNGNGRIEGAERGPMLREKLAAISAGLSVTAGGKAVRLGAPSNARMSFPQGQGGLKLTRVVTDLEAPLPSGGQRVTFADRTFESHPVGWKAIEVLPGDGTDVKSSVPASDVTQSLRRYPKDLLQSPLDQRQATFAVTPGNGGLTAPAGPHGGAVTKDRAQDGFAGALVGGNTHGFLILLLLGAAFGWGALHALSPGHGKAMVAGYLVGARGTSRHAAILGLTVTVTHTVAVFALGLVILAASQYILPEQLYPWLGVASGMMVVGIGLWVMRSRFQRWRRLRAALPAPTAAAVAGDHAHDHPLEPDRDHNHAQARDHAHAHAPGYSHTHDRHHSHVPEGPITMRSLLALGVSGGLVPCPSALVVLIAAISQHRIGLGMVLILAFSLGLAATLTAVGLAVVFGGRAIARLRPERRLLGARLAGALPAASATIIVLAGVLIALRAIPQIG